MMIKYGLDLVDADGVECYVDSSPDTLAMYEKFGWVKVHEKEFMQLGDFRYVESYCVRLAERKKN
ncbi:hypothetical protein PAAG_11446 [Paracoccidioides lutzii Pb01]|uniref:N-acetyltransferase domain-containing protein n=1 Tax=Paracoccidioides lutzii (strain ATCC MYA-826 / Pb01) TaxID=502779 RepID=A0A0A2V6X7_PARBA|nr:hypothetical protein PAAG_11446 [Paracoccidioides lutzii Pb01]KGQ01870.1 hypothetical protein PAAG_11446 [Paracoccidioides lutzii Pb01]